MKTNRYSLSQSHKCPLLYSFPLLLPRETGGNPSHSLALALTQLEVTRLDPIEVKQNRTEKLRSLVPCYLPPSREGRDPVRSFRSFLPSHHPPLPIDRSRCRSLTRGSRAFRTPTPTPAPTTAVRRPRSPRAHRPGEAAAAAGVPRGPRGTPRSRGRSPPGSSER